MCLLLRGELQQVSVVSIAAFSTSCLKVAVCMHKGYNIKEQPGILIWLGYYLPLS
jgi:hypothetical protein